MSSSLPSSIRRPWLSPSHSKSSLNSYILNFPTFSIKSLIIPAATRGPDAEGAVPSDTRILFAIGGYAYSLAPNPWAWLTSQEAAEAIAEEVATWRDLYNIDGIDLDIEAGAGDKQVRTLAVIWKD